MTQSIAVRRAEALRARPSEDSLGFGRHFTDHMFVVDYAPGRGWHGARVEPYGPLPVDPAAAVLHYGQAVFEGLKVFPGADGVVRGFRVDDHCRRLNASAARLCIPPVDGELLRAGIAAVVREDRDWIPTAPGTSLYVRPTIVGTEGFLGVRPSAEYTCFVILTPVGGYFSGGAVRIWVEEHRVRAAPGGLGAAKTGANYAASLAAAVEARERGYAQVLWLDACGRRHVEEVGTMNLFVHIGDEVVTAPLGDTLLAGVTRDSVLALLRDWGVRVSERPLAVAELREAHRRGELREAFGTGTAAVVSPVGGFGFEDGDLEVGDGSGSMGDLARRLYDAITGIQSGRLPDRFGWMTPIC